MVKLNKPLPILALFATLAVSSPTSYPQGPPAQPPLLTDILPIDLTLTLGPLLTIDLARVLEAVLAGVTSTLLDLPLIEELGKFLHGAGEELICGTDKALCDTLERWCMVAQNQGESGGDLGISGGSRVGGRSEGSGYALPPPTRDSMMSALGGDPVGYLNEWIGSHYSPAPSPPSGPPSSGPLSDPGCHCSTIPPTQGQQLQSWVENHGQSVNPDILSSLRLCAIGGIAEAISEHARELLMQWLDGDCPLEDVVKHVVVGWLGVGSGTSAPVSGPGGSSEGSAGYGSSLPPIGGAGPAVAHGPPSHGVA